MWITAAVQRYIDALKIIQRDNPRLEIYITFGANPTGPYDVVEDMIRRAAAAKVNVTAWTAMPFDFECCFTRNSSMLIATKTALDATQAAVAKAYGYDSETAYRRIGVSSMNGKTDLPGETVTLADFVGMREYARNHKLGRLTFWSANRDNSRSGTAQAQYAFTKVIAEYHR